jgi:predicted translin family RNA/ssDNA-binding protein
MPRMKSVRCANRVQNVDVVRDRVVQLARDLNRISRFAQAKMGDLT